MLALEPTIKRKISKSSGRVNYYFDYESNNLPFSTCQAYISFKERAKLVLIQIS